MQRLLLLLGLLISAVTAGTAAAQDAAPGDIADSRFVTSSTTDALEDVVLDFFPTGQFINPRYSVDEYAVEFYTQSEDGEPIPVSAQVYVPVINEPLSAPVLVYGAGTTGLIDECAPSREDPDVADWGSYRDYLRTYATQGFITIMPDYPYFDNPDRLQPYYVAEMQGRVALDAARAIYNLYENGDISGSGLTTPDDYTFIGGYSQGGTTVFGARDIQPDYAPDVPLAGILPFGSVTDQKNHMLTRPEFAGYRWVSWEEYYGQDQVDLSVIFADLYLPTIRTDSTTMCVREVFGFYPADPTQVYQEPFYEALANETMAEDFPAHNELLELNSPGITARDIPVLMLQGELDETIPPAKMAEFLTAYCQLEGNTVTYNEYTGVTHFDTRQVAYRDTINWMAQIISGETPPDDCGDFTG